MEKWIWLMAKVQTLSETYQLLASAGSWFNTMNVWQLLMNSYETMNIGFVGAFCRNAKTFAIGRFQPELMFASLQTNGFSWSKLAVQDRHQRNIHPQISKLSASMMSMAASAARNLIAICSRLGRRVYFESPARRERSLSARLSARSRPLSRVEV